MSVNMAAVSFESIQYTLSWLCEISLYWLKIGPKNAHFIPVWVKFGKSYIPQIFVESSLFENQAKHLWTDFKELYPSVENESRSGVRQIWETNVVGFGLFIGLYEKYTVEVMASLSC